MSAKLYIMSIKLYTSFCHEKFGPGAKFGPRSKFWNEKAAKLISSGNTWTQRCQTW